jgi:hypothetical protein
MPSAEEKIQSAGDALKCRPELRREKSLFAFGFYYEADRNFVAPK